MTDSDLQNYGNFYNSGLPHDQVTSDVACPYRGRSRGSGMQLYSRSSAYMDTACWGRLSSSAGLAYSGPAYSIDCAGEHSGLVWGSPVFRGRCFCW